MIKTAVIIAGGVSMRLRPLTEDKPKTLMEVNGKPILYWILKWLKTQGIEHVVIGVAYKKEKIYEYMERNNNLGFKVDFSEHTVEGGTAQAFRLAISRFIEDEDFLAMNGDELTNLDISKMWEFHKKNNAIATLGVAPFHCKFSVVEYDDNCKIVGFEMDKRLQNVPVHIGINIFNKKIKELIPETGNFEAVVFKRLVEEEESRFFSYMLKEGEGWMSINTQKDLDEANAYLTESQANAWWYNSINRLSSSDQNQG